MARRILTVLSFAAFICGGCGGVPVTEGETELEVTQSLLAKDDTTWTSDKVCKDCGCTVSGFQCDCGLNPSQKKLDCIKNGGPKKVGVSLGKVVAPGETLASP